MYCSVHSLSRVRLCDHCSTAHQTSISFTISQRLLKLISIELVMPSNHLILCHPLLILPSIIPSLRVFPVGQFFASGSQSMEHQHQSCQWILGLISIRIDWFDLLAVQGLSRVNSNTTVQKHQFFSARPSLWSNSHIYTWPLGKNSSIGLDGSLLAKLCLCFLICYPGWS